MSFNAIACGIGLLATTGLQSLAGEPVKPWQLGMPIVTYWAGPPMTDATAQQMTRGGWNLVWYTESELDVAERHGVRAQLQDPLLTPASLEKGDSNKPEPCPSKPLRIYTFTFHFRQFPVSD